jgi:hypothetical protein
MSGRGGKEKNYQLLPGLEPPIIQPVAQPYTTELSRLLLGVDRRIILNWIGKKSVLRLWTRFSWLRIWSSGGSCEHGYEPWGSIEGEELLCQLLKEDSASC